MVRTSGGFNDHIAGGDDALDDGNESELQEKEMSQNFTCRVRVTQCRLSSLWL